MPAGSTESAGIGPGTSLPARFPIFPLAGALLLPGGNLPLNIFEPRYLQMMRDAMQADRVIGMIQPAAEDGPSPALYSTGCCGHITSLSETDDGRYLVTLSGACRFDVVEELAVTSPYRQVVASFARWLGDLRPDPPPQALRGELLAVLRGYFAARDLDAEWDAIESAPLAGLITSLAMICPFGAREKQALLEAPDIAAQGRVLVALLRMEAVPTGGVDPGSARH